MPRKRSLDTKSLCVYCGERATCIDHIRPKSRGGLDIESNRVPSCHSCNSSKLNRLLTQWDIKRVLYGVSQDVRVFMEVIELAATPEDKETLRSYQTTVTEQVSIASRLMHNRNPKITGFIKDQIRAREIESTLSASTKKIGELITLREAVETGIVNKTYSAATRARSRAGNNFPIGYPSSSGIMYKPSDLIAFFHGNVMPVIAHRITEISPEPSNHKLPLEWTYQARKAATILANQRKNTA